MPLVFVLALGFLLCTSAAQADGKPAQSAGAQRAEGERSHDSGLEAGDSFTDAETIGGHEEAWWSSQALAHERAVERLEGELSKCEEREAPRAYRNVPGQVFRGRDGLRYREVVHCDDLRAELEAAREAQDEFEDLARRLEVPPGWLH